MDTVYNRNNTVTTVFKKDYSDSEFLGGFNNSKCTALSTSLFGDSLYIVVDTSIFYINSDEIRWETNSKSWVFYSDTSNNQLLIIVDSTIAFGTDSIRYYSFTSSASPNHDLHQFDTAQIILSKNKGMLSGFDFSVFPDTLEEIVLLKKGPITYRDIYDYEIGEEYHYIVSSDNNYQGIQLNDRYIVEVLNKIVYSTDSVSYQMEYTIADEIRMINQGHPTKRTVSYVDTFWTYYNLNKVIVSGTFIDSIGANDSIGVGFFSDAYDVSNYTVNEILYVLHQGKLCNIFFEHDQYTEYIFGIGSFFHNFHADMSGTEFYDENLVYYKKGNRTWGSPLSIVVGLNEKTKSNIIVSPIPANDFIFIDGIQSFATFEIFDIAGRKVKEGKLKNDKTKISVADIVPGIYIIKVKDDQLEFSRKIVIQ